MTGKNPKTVTETQRQVDSIINLYPFEDSDFKDNGYLTDEAVERVKSAALEVIPKETFRKLGEEAFEENIALYMEELAAVGALTPTVTSEGLKAFTKVRDWTDEESEAAWLRVKAKAGWNPDDFE